MCCQNNCAESKVVRCGLMKGMKVGRSMPTTERHTLFFEYNSGRAELANSSPWVRAPSRRIAAPAASTWKSIEPPIKLTRG